MASHRGIARSLNARGVATARGGEWTAVQSRESFGGLAVSATGSMLSQAAMAAGLASPVGWPTLPEFRKKPRPDNFRNFPRGRPLPRRARAHPCPLWVKSGHRSRRYLVRAMSGDLSSARSDACPRWVKSRHRKGSAECLLYPQKRTLIEGAGCPLCQKQTFVAYWLLYAIISRTTPPTMTATAATNCGPTCSCLRNTKLSRSVTRG